MRNLLFLLSKIHALLLFIVLEIIAFSLISKSHTYQGASISNTSNWFTGSFYNFSENYTQYFGLRNENIALQKENARLRGQLKYFANYPKQDSIYPKRDSLSSYIYIPAKVINNTIYKTHNFITINKGSNDGIKVDMGVMNSNGVVGIVSKVSDNYALVMSILNTNTSISVKHKKSGAFGNFKWKGFNPTIINVEDMSKTANVKKGDTIVTSGYSTIFPPDFPIAIAKNVKTIKESGFQKIESTPTADINKIDYVYIVEKIEKMEIDSLESEPSKPQLNDR